MSKVTMEKEQRLETVLALRRRIAELDATQAKLNSMNYALHVSETRYRRLFETAQDGILILDAETGQINDVNPFLVETLGYSRGDFLGKKLWEACAFKDIQENKLSLEELKKKSDVRYESLPLKTRDGRIIDVEFMSNSYRVDRREVIQCNIRDIRERRRRERERRDLEVRAELQSRLASVAKMASGIAHEMNDPLTGVIGYSQLLLRKELAPDIRHDVKIISEGAQRVASIMNRLLTFSRQDKPERGCHDINEIVTTSLALQARALEEGNIRVITELDSALPSTMVDAGQMQQVFLNIIANAGEEMKLAHGKGSLWIRTEKADDTIRISFADDGPGIAEENLQRIFEPFFTTREGGEGIGLGLSICHRVVAEHNGRTYAKSEMGKGAAFTVELPIVLPSSAHLRRDDQAAVQARIKEKTIRARILVVDDEPMVLSLLERVLSDEGYEVESVDNATAALDWVKGESYHLILLDIMMPGMSGIEFYERIRDTDKSLAKRIVFITGDVMGKQTRDFLVSNNAHYVIKPFDVQWIKAYISRILTQDLLDAAKEDPALWRLIKSEHGQEPKEKTP